MIENPQSVCAIIGSDGCYELCIFKQCVDRGAGDTLDILTYHEKFIHAGYLGKDCYVFKPDRMVSALIGGEWQLLKAGDGFDSSGKGYDLPLGYECQGEEFEILRLERRVGTKTIAHFVCGDGKGHMTWDPYLNSETAKSGFLVSKRIFRRV